DGGRGVGRGRLRRSALRFLVEAPHFQRDTEPAQGQCSAQAPRCCSLAKAAQPAFRLHPLNLFLQLEAIEAVEKPFAEGPAGPWLGHAKVILQGVNQSQNSAMTWLIAPFGALIEM